LASASGSGAARDEEIEEEDDGNYGADGDDEEEEGEVFDVEEINPPNYVDMGPLVFRVPSNPTWRVKVSYKGRTDFVRENRRILVLALIKRQLHAPTCRVNVWNNHVFTLSTNLVP
jgi:hypothetical protein